MKKNKKKIKDKKKKSFFNFECVKFDLRILVIFLLYDSLYWIYLLDFNLYLIIKLILIPFLTLFVSTLIYKILNKK